jgi:hypothetical protein
MNHAYTRLLKTLPLLCLLACIQFTWATITVDSVHLSPSTCPNNGSAKVYARSDHNGAMFLFNIITGPVTYPQQNDSTFRSLYPGNYTGWVHDVNSFDSTQFTFIITGSYETPQVSISGSSPLCLNSNTGQIIGYIQTGTGLPPYLWQIFSPYTGPEQQSDTFNNLGQGSYIIRLTDACNVSRSVSIALDTGGTGLQPNLYVNNYTTYIGCGTAVYYGFFSIYISKAYLPFTLIETTSTGTVTKQIYPQVYDTTNIVPPVFYFTDTLTGVQFGGPFSITLRDICDSAIAFQPTTFLPFDFYFLPLSDTCGNTGGTIVAQDSDGVYSSLDFDDQVPLHVTVQNAQTLQLVDSFTAIDMYSLNAPCFNCPLFQQQPPNENFILTVTDGCGDIPVQTFSSPQTYPLSCNVTPEPVSCLDSTGTANFFLNGFGATVNITFLTGPLVSESSNPLFAYHRPIFYPVSIDGLSANFNEVNISNLPPGFYTYTISDLCGHSLTDTFTMNQVQQLYINAPVNSNCNGTSNIEISLPTSESYLYVYSLPGHDPVQISMYDYNYLVANNCQPGTYVLSVGFQNETGTALPGNAECSHAIETLVVPNYNDSIIKSTYTALCNGDIYLIVLADTNNGPVPFEYEILSGPQTFPLQSTGLFQVNAWGTYLLGALDSCGNEDTRYVTLDTGRILPVVRAGGMCTGGVAVLNETASPYFRYRWVMPGGRVYNGSSIVINPFTLADTGLVHITQYVTVNGCIDSVSGTYYLAYNDTFNNTFPYTVNLCANDTLWVGNNYHTQAGVYTDTLTTVYGCDSVVVSTVYLLPALQANIIAQSFDSCTSGLTVLTGSGGTSYLWQPGNLYGQTILVDPGDSTTYYLTVTDTGVCSATDSILVYGFPSVGLNQDVAYICNKTAAELCAAVTGVSYLWSDGSTTQCITTLTEGLYTVTITTGNGCTAVSEAGQVIALNPPLIENHNDTLYCATTDTFGYNYYQWTLNGNPIPGANGARYVPRQTGTYNCIVSDTTNCQATGNDISFVTGLTRLQPLAEVWISPNPTFGKLSIQTQNFNPESITIYDDAGRLISILSFKNEIDINSLSSGIYFMEITGSEGVVRKRVVKM